MNTEEETPKIKSGSRGKVSPWITTILIVVYAVIIEFMLTTSMEEAFNFVEDFFEKMASSIWYIGVPLPLIVALFFYFYGSQDKDTNLKLFIFSSTALGFIIISIVLYFIIDPIQFFPSSKTNFVYFAISITCSLLLALLSLIIRMIIVKRKSLR